MIFADASALVKLYVRERHSRRVRTLLTAEPVAASRLSEVEVPSALVRLARQGRLTVRSRDRAVSAFVADLAAWHIVEVTTAVTAIARIQLSRHELRAGDAVQLGSAIWLRQAAPLAGLLAFDTRIVAAAMAEQFTLLIPPGDRPRNHA